MAYFIQQLKVRKVSIKDLCCVEGLSVEILSSFQSELLLGRRIRVSEYLCIHCCHCRCAWLVIVWPASATINRLCILLSARIYRWSWIWERNHI